MVDVGASFEDELEDVVAAGVVVVSEVDDVVKDDEVELDAVDP